MKAETLPVNLVKKAGSLDTAGARKRFFANVSSNAAFIAAQAFATIWLTPFLIGHLGIAAYGMIPLVMTITGYMAIFTTALENAFSRYLAIDMKKGDETAANRTFNTGFFGMLGVIIILVPFVLSIGLTFPRLFDVPPGWERDASWLFALAAVGFFFTIIGSVFAVSPFVHSQFTLGNIANFAMLMARIGFIVLLFSVFDARLAYAGAGILAGAASSLMIYLILWRKLTPELNLQITAFDRFRFKELIGMGGWVVVNMAGAMLLGRVDLIVINAFFGAAMTGGYGAVAQFSLLMEYIVSAAGSVVRPVILIKYAQGDYAGLQRLTGQSVKLLGLALSLPVGLLCGFSRPLLIIWLGSEFEYLNILLIVVVFHLSLNLSVRPLLFVQNACNRVRWPGIATLLSGLGSLGLAILAAKWGKWGAAGVAMAVAVAWTLKNGVYMPIYTAHIIKLPWWTFFPNLAASVIGTIFTALISYGLTLLRMPDSWLTLCISAAVVSVIYALAAWMIGMNSADRRLLKDLTPLRSRVLR